MRKKFLSLILGTALSILCVGLVACSKNNGNNSDPDNSNNGQIVQPEPQPTVSITLSTSSAALEVGDEYALSVSITPASADGKVIWSSSNEAVATVSNSGVVTAKSSGTAIIKATISGKSASCNVKVDERKKPGTAVTVLISKTQISVAEGDTYKLAATLDPSTDESIEWSSTDDKVATVDKNGTVTGISEGTAFIKATAESGNSATCIVEVKRAYGSISGTITCRNQRTNTDEVDVKTKIYLVSYEVKNVNLNVIMMGYEYNYPDDGIYQVSVDTSGAYKFEDLKPGKYRMIINCKGTNFQISSTAKQRKNVLGEIYDKGSAQDKGWVETQVVYNAQMSGFDVTVGNKPLTITRNIYGVYTGTNVQ